MARSVEVCAKCDIRVLHETSTRHLGGSDVGLIVSFSHRLLDLAAVSA
jgi:hypothetical protein